MKRAQSGFTLIELMIVVAIIAILAAIAIPAYNSYIREARMSKVVDHYDTAYRALKSELARRASMQARGTTPAAINLIEIVNPENRSAPQGGTPAFAAASVNANGVVGLSNTGAVGSEVILITQPNYLDLPEATVSISAVDL